MRSTFKVLFYLKRNAPKKNGLVPVMCRVTVNGKVSQFSCKLDVEEKSWNVELGRLSGRSLIAQEGNRVLDKIRVGINKAYQEICDRDNYVTAEKVRNAFLGMGMKHETLLAVFSQHNEDYAKQVGKIKSERSYWKYCTVYNHLSEFIKQRYKVSDIALKELTPAFITDFELFLRTEKDHCTNTVWSYMMPLRRIIYMAINNGWLQRDPFYGYSITKEETKRGFLTKEEITLLINGTFKKKSYELIRDLFIFCTFTGLSWRDMANLTKENLEISFDGHLWIKTNRQKTGTESNIRLLEVAKHIIEKYEGMAKDGKLLPVPCYPNCKNGIKVIAKRCGIDKNITWHVARHSYATTVCLSNDVPIETLSKMLGHRSIRTTQIYAKITAEKVSRDMEKLSKQMSRWNHLSVRQFNQPLKSLPMKREKITISEPTTNREQSSLLELPRCEGGRRSQNGIITLPSNPTEAVWMRDFEIAELFGVMLPTIKSNIRVILKSNVITEDTTNGATLIGCNILPDYFGLDMVVALAFRINSMNAQLFRDFVTQKMTSTITQSVIPLYISVGRDFVQKQSEYVN